MEISSEQRRAHANNPENAEFESVLAPHIKPTGKLDLELLFKIAEKNGLGDMRREYSHLNAGQVRMNIGNKLRPIWKEGQFRGLDDVVISPCRPVKSQSFTISHAGSSPFANDGLRSFFEYRDLNIKTATNNQFGANVIRAVPGAKSPGTWHTHDLDFQMVYVTQGWVVFEYEGEGEHMLRAGSCVLQPPGIRHREVRHSDDMELIEITSPAEFTTSNVNKP